MSAMPSAVLFSTLVDRLASALYEADNFIEPWAHASDADRAEYVVIAAREIAAYRDAHRAEVLGEAAEKVRENSRQRYSSVIANIGTSAAMRWFQGRESAADLIDPEWSAKP